MTNQKRNLALPLDLHALGRHPGEMIERHMNVPAPADLAVGMVGVPKGSPVDLSVTCQSVGDGVLVQGDAEVTLAGQCARCLADFEQPGRFELQELYYYPGKGPDDAKDEDEVLFVVDNVVDLDPVLRAAIVLNLPFSPLCSSDCAGLCPVCGADLNDDPNHHHDEPVDTRWAKLKDVIPNNLSDQVQ
ncbi:MAG: DUF177 domain-containing protein [Propionibacteriaceae bacterium]|nr:DUF177 domain-containing protein [Propionibacteriaceae bacterium]